ncbi:MAG: Phytochrome-like protein cph2 [Firmicutes bacterium ADurb.Bin419]|nr:MAG: Phytochrome-like protein cph2 [Firmicutes bacterium ADurb.Bin419]
MFYCIKRYGFIVKAQDNIKEDVANILSEDGRVKLYLYLSLAYLLGGFVNFIAQYFSKRETLEISLTFGIMMALFGLILYVVQKTKIDMYHKDILSNIITTISIPIMILKHSNYSPFYAGLFPVFFIISSIAFNKRLMLIMNGSSTILTLIWVWIKLPTVTVTFTITDHIVRICAVVAIIAMAFYINYVYTRRLFENEEKLIIQKLLSRISSIFVNTNDSNIDDRINEVLRLCGEHYKTDRVYALIFSDGQKNLNLIYEWRLAGIEPRKDIFNEMDVTKITEWINVDRILQQGNICISDVAATSEDSMEKEYMNDNKIKSMIISPLWNQDCIIGLMGFENVSRTINVKEYQKETLKVLAHLLSDIVLKVEAEKEIKYRANYDALTGLPNRAMFMSQLRRDINMAKRAEKLVGVVFVDIDSFKYLNDTLGHDGGDSLLLKIGERISGCLRIYDIVARFGGDEFVIIIPQASYVEDICSVAVKITDSFKQPLTVNNQEFFVTVSMGVSVFPLDGTEAEELVKNADAAMCVSKENGKNKYTLCSAFLKEEIEVNALLSNSLHLALQRKEFLLYYQPQVNSITGEIVGVEALIRWNHPEKGMISPGVFIPLTEKNGLISHIGQWVLHEACVQNKIWQSMGLPPIRMAVNLSLGQFLNSNLVATVESILKKTELDPSLLELEVTESIATYDPEYIISTLNKLKALGVMISIDDFGTEYSSLSRLKIMPVDKIKIDMRFIQGICTGSKDESIVKVMLQLGKTFGLKVLAEGVENEQQLEFLRENYCDEIQGYYFYKPMRAEELEHILKNIKSH